MSLDNNIDRTVAGYLWLGTGAIGVYWLNALGSQVREDIGGWWRYFFGPEPGDEARAKVRGLHARMWGFIAAWLGMYLVLDWLF
jgi:hypothetical protein